MTRVIKAQEGATSGVLNLADLAAEAKTVVLDARQEAARILAEARAQAEAMQASDDQHGYEEGFARGREEGYAHGKRQARKEAQETLSADMSSLAELAGRIVSELSALRNQMLEQAREELLELAIELAGKVVGKVVARDIEPAKVNLAKVLAHVRGQAKVTVKVNPQQVDDLRTHCRGVLAAMNSGLLVELVGDADIAPGGLKLQSGRGVIDATIGTQLRNIAETLLSAKRQEAGE